jgi:hypothetical protein
MLRWSSLNESSKNHPFNEFVNSIGTVSKQVEERNQKAIAEIIKRPNIWFIPPNTKINVQVNRSLRL